MSCFVEVSIVFKWDWEFWGSFPNVTFRALPLVLAVLPRTCHIFVPDRGLARLASGKLELCRSHTKDAESQHFGRERGCTLPLFSSQEPIGVYRNLIELSMIFYSLN